MKKLFRIFVALLVLLPLAYGGSWAVMANQIGKHITQFYDHDFEAMGGRFYGEKPTITGFPFAPVITYRDGVRHDNVDIKFSEARLSGFPLPLMPLTLNIAGDIEITELGSNSSLTLDYFKAQVQIPKSFPANNSRAAVTRWQKHNEKIDINLLETAKTGMVFIGNGTIGLDENLQATLNLNTKISGYEKLIAFLVETGELKPFPAALAIGTLNAMAQKDPVTGEASANITIRIQDRNLFAGPINLLKLPRTEWPN